MGGEAKGLVAWTVTFFLATTRASGEARGKRPVANTRTLDALAHKGSSLVACNWGDAAMIDVARRVNTPTSLRNQKDTARNALAPMVFAILL